MNEHLSIDDFTGCRSTTSFNDAFVHGVFVHDLSESDIHCDHGKMHGCVSLTKDAFVFHYKTTYQST